MSQLTKKEKIGVAVGVVVVLAIFVGADYYKFFPFASNPYGNSMVQSDQQSEEATSTPMQTVSPAQPQKPSTTNTSMNTYTTADGLNITDEVVGTGTEAVAGDTVTVNYTGTFTNGQVFDSSLQPGRTPFSFVLGAGQVISGWDEGVAGMKVGGKRKLVIPPSLGYGPNDYGPIPGNSTLDFEVELLGVTPGQN